MDRTDLAMLAVRTELARRHPDDAWQWALAHCTPHGRPLVDIPALRDIVCDPHPMVVVQKSAQVGVTEAMVAYSLWTCDSGYAGRGHVLYLMPTADQAADFVQSRIDPVIQRSPYLQQRLAPIPPRRKGADNLRVKQIGPGTLFTRGSESARQVSSVDADVVILDEFDQMPDGVIDLARRRVASSTGGRVLAVSTPRYPEAGINALFLQSDQRYYHIPCRACGHAQALTFEDNVDRSRACIVCARCREPLDVLTPGRWIARAPGNAWHGYHLSRLYSPWLNVAELIEASEATTPHALQQFQNSDLGEVFSPPGGGLSLAEFLDARDDYAFADYAGQPCAMGVDVGLEFHVVIREIPPRAERERARWGNADLSSFPYRLWYAGQVKHIDEVGELLSRFNVEYCIVDGQPEAHLVKEFARRHRGQVRLARYRPAPGHERTQEQGVSWYLINRVEAMDETLQAFRDGRARLPRNAREIGRPFRQGTGEYCREVMAPQRTLEPDSNGNLTSRYEDRGKDDHYAHAELYCRVAAGIPPRPVALVSGARKSAQDDREADGRTYEGRQARRRGRRR